MTANSEWLLISQNFFIKSEVVQIQICQVVYFQTTKILMFISTHLYTNRVLIVRFSHIKCLDVLIYSLLIPGPLLGAKCNVFWLAHSLARRFLRSLVLTWFGLESKHSFVWLNIFI